MTEQQKSTLKIISAIVTIILLPVLFFHFIGENPTKKVSNATREIAVVNEDTGVLKDDGTVDQDALLGNEISAYWLTVRIINGRSSTGAQQKADLRRSNTMRLSTFRRTFRKTF